MLFFKSDRQSFLCPFCRNEIKNKSKAIHNNLCIRLHLIWFIRYEILCIINTGKLIKNVDLDSYNNHLSKLDRILEKEDIKWKLTFHKNLQQSLDMKLNDFEFIKPLTKGGYGQIFLTRDIISGNNMITKIISISEAIQRSCIESYVNERQLLLKCKSDFIVSLFYSFMSEFFIYQVS